MRDKTTTAGTHHGVKSICELKPSMFSSISCRTIEPPGPGLVSEESDVKLIKRKMDPPPSPSTSSGLCPVETFEEDFKNTKY